MKKLVLALVASAFVLGCSNRAKDTDPKLPAGTKPDSRFEPVKLNGKPDQTKK